MTVRAAGSGEVEVVAGPKRARAEPFHVDDCAGGYPSIWFHDGRAPIAPMHVAFAPQDRATVDQFFAAAIAAGARDNGPPGVRTPYHDAYCAAYVLDPEGNNIEVVFG